MLLSRAARAASPRFSRRLTQVQRFHGRGHLSLRVAPWRRHVSQPHRYSCSAAPEQPRSSAPAITGIGIGDDPSAWRRAGFTVGDDATVQVGRTTLHLAGAKSGKRGILWWELGVPGKEISEWNTGDTLGLPTIWTAIDEAPILDQNPALSTSDAHDNGSRKLDHVVIIATDAQEAKTSLECSLQRPPDLVSRYQSPFATKRPVGHEQTREQMPSVAKSLTMTPSRRRAGTPSHSALRHAG